MIKFLIPTGMLFDYDKFIEDKDSIKVVESTFNDGRPPDDAYSVFSGASFNEILLNENGQRGFVALDWYRKGGQEIFIPCRPAWEIPDPALQGMALARWFLELDEMKRAGAAMLEKLKPFAEEAQERTIAHFDQEGLSSVKIDGKNLYLRAEFWAKAKEDIGKEKAIEALRNSGLTDLITPETFNSKTMSAYIREEVKAERELPPEIKAAFDFAEKYKLGVRKA